MSDYAEMQSLERQLKTDAATDTLASELSRLCRTVVAAAGVDDPRLPDAVAALLAHIGVYRSDYRGLASVLSTALAETAADTPELAAPLQSSRPRSPAAANPRCACSSCAAR